MDTNVLIDVVTADPAWSGWSLSRIKDALKVGPVFVNDVVYAEISTRYGTFAEVDAMLANATIGMAPIPRDALFMAGKAYLRYRKAGGARSGVLPDFFIGAHAAVEGWPLLTRDARRYRSYFPTLELIAPNG